MLRCLVSSSRPRRSIQYRCTQQQQQRVLVPLADGQDWSIDHGCSSSGPVALRSCARSQRVLFSTRTLTTTPSTAHHTLLCQPSSISPIPHATPTHHRACRPTASSPHSSHHHHQYQYHKFQQIRTKVFVSRHNNCLNVTAAGIMEYLSNHGVPTSSARTTTSHVILEECPFCTKPTHGKADNQYKLYIQVGGGAYFCHRCGTNGSWYDFKAQVGGYQVATGLSTPTSNSAPASAYSKFAAGGGGSAAAASKRSMGRVGGGGTGAANSGGGGVIVGGGSTTDAACLPMPQGKLSACYSSALLDKGSSSSSSSSNSNNDDTPHGGGGGGGDDNSVLRYLLETRGLTRSTLRKYGVGRATYNFPTKEGGYQPAECVTFPWIMRGSDVAYQEQLRGAHFPVDIDDTEDHNNNDDDDSTNKTKNGDILPLEKPPARRGRKPRIPIKDTTTNEKDNHDLSSSFRSPDESPLFHPKGKFVTRRIKVRAVAEKSWQRLDPPGGGWGLFGLHTVPDHATEIVLTEGEYDAMAVWQATGIPAVSLPNGCRSLPVQVLPLLERFDKVYLWMDNDAPGQEGADKFSKKIGLDRSYLVKCSTAKDANDALLKGLDLSRMLQEARPVPHDRILTFSDLRNDVLDEMLNPDRYSGVPLPSLPNFTKLIKGFRRGEMTVLTGPTGSGKTTFLGQASLDLAEQGINCLWGSFEIKNTRLVHKLLKQFARGAILPTLEDGSTSQTSESVEKLKALADRFEGLPLYFMKFHGGSEVDDVLDAMEYAVYVNDVEHIILDNLQFMISRIGGKGSTFDKFDIQDVAIEKFRKFSTEHNVHITLVVHPRKEDETSKLNMSSFYGSAKATQEADTVAILQNDGRRKYIEVKKNRFDGTLGYTPLHFHRESGRYVEDEQGVPDSGGGMGVGLPSTTFSTSPFKPKPKPFFDKGPPPSEKEIEGLENFWTNCLAPKRA